MVDRHFGFVEEYLWQMLDPRPLPLGTAIWIVDLGGMGLSDLGSEAFQFYKRMSVEVGMHYPERLSKYACLLLPYLVHSLLSLNKYGCLIPPVMCCLLCLYEYACLLIPNSCVGCTIETATLDRLWAQRPLVQKKGRGGISLLGVIPGLYPEAAQVALNLTSFGLDMLFCPILSLQFAANLLLLAGP